MVPSFEFFDFGANRRAYTSAADRERAGYLAELTQSGLEASAYDTGVEYGSEQLSPRHVTIGVS